AAEIIPFDADHFPTLSLECLLPASLLKEHLIGWCVIEVLGPAVKFQNHLVFRPAEVSSVPTEGCIDFELKHRSVDPQFALECARPGFSHGFRTCIHCVENPSQASCTSCDFASVHIVMHQKRISAPANSLVCD